MKTFFNLPVIVFLATSLTVLNVIPAVIHGLHPSSMEVAIAQTATVPASLPASADVRLKNGRTWQGQVVDIDASRQTLTIQGDSAHVIPLAEIERVSFSTTAVAYDVSGRPILRSGSGQPAGSPVTWNPVAISGLRLNSQVRGSAQIILGSSVTNVDRSGQHIYVLDALEFDPQAGTMAVTATPY